MIIGAAAPPKALLATPAELAVTRDEIILSARPAEAILGVSTRGLSQPYSMSDQR